MDKKMTQEPNKGHTVSDRVFGMVMGTLLTLLSLGPWIFGKNIKLPLLYVAGALFVLGIVCPILLKWPKTIWLWFTGKIAIVVNFLLLGIIFFAVVTPVALFFRLIGRDALHKKWDKNAQTYWVSRGTQPATMENQF